MLTYIVKRTQIYIEDDQDRLLEGRAKAAGTTKSALIRRAIDAFLKNKRENSELERLLEKTAGSMPDLRVPSRDEWDRGFD